MPSALPNTGDQIACEMKGHPYPWDHGDFVSCMGCYAPIPEEYLPGQRVTGYGGRKADPLAVRHRIIDIGLESGARTGVPIEPEVAAQLHRRCKAENTTAPETILQQHWCARLGHPHLWEQSEAPMSNGTIVYICGGCNGEVSSTLLDAAPHVDLAALQKGADKRAHDLLDEVDRLAEAQSQDGGDAGPIALLAPDQGRGIQGRHVDQVIIDDPLMDGGNPGIPRKAQRWAEAIQRQREEGARTYAQEYANTPTPPSSPEEAEQWRSERLGAVKQMESLGTVFSPQVQHMLDDTLSLGSSMLADNAADAQADEDPDMDPRSEEALSRYKAMREDYAETGRRLPPDDLVIRIVKDMREMSARLADLELSGSLADDVRRAAMDRLGEAIRTTNGLLPSSKHA
jgi:hypothetical protein